MNREPIENLAVAILLSLFLDYAAVWELDSNRIRDMRYNRAGRPLRHRRGRPTRRSTVARKREFEKWIKESREELSNDVFTWGANMAEELGLTSRDNWIKIAEDVREQHKDSQ